MPLRRHKRSRAEHPFVGTWHITAMEGWDDDYVNMEQSALVEIGPANVGSFQFGLVCGQLDGYLAPNGTFGPFMAGLPLNTRGMRPYPPCTRRGHSPSSLTPRRFRIEEYPS